MIKNGLSTPDVHNTFKLFKHLDKLYEWDKSGDTYPITAHIDLTNTCNHKCPECIRTAFNNETIPYESMTDLVLQLKEAQVRSFVLAGGGDPTCHPKLPDILTEIKRNEIDIGLYTNAFSLSENCIENIIENCTWLRISLDADSPETYKTSHGMGEHVFNKVVDNIKKLIALKNKHKKDIVIGIGYLVGPDTIDGAYNATLLSKNIGADYIRIRPYFNWGGQKSYLPEEITSMSEQLKKCLQLKNDHFNVTFPQHRTDWILNNNRFRPYSKCFALSFHTLIAANLKVYPCCHLSNNDEYIIGDLKKNSFKEIWASKQRKEIMTQLSFKDCPNPCMLDGHNRLLWDIHKPMKHSNFL